MSGWYDHLLTVAGRLVARRFPNHVEEILATARVLGRQRGVWGRVAELASLVRLSLEQPARPARRVWLHGAVLAAFIVTATSIAGWSPLLAIPFVFLILGSFDARLAAGATLFWAGQLVTTDLYRVQIDFGDSPLSIPWVRWMLMLLIVLSAVHITRRSIQRAATI